MTSTQGSALRLTLISHAATAAMRRGQLADDDMLDARGIADVRHWASRVQLPAQAAVLCSPARCALATAQAAGLAGQVEPALRDIDVGRWRGQRFTHLGEAQPEALQSWLRNSDMAAHGGESFAMLRERVGQWMEALAGQGDMIAISHAWVLRAAILHALDASSDGFHRIEVAPLSVVRLRRGSGGWAWLAHPLEG